MRSAASDKPWRNPTLASGSRLQARQIPAGLFVGLSAGSLVGLVPAVGPKVGVPLVLATVFTGVLAASRNAEKWCVQTFLIAIPLPMHAFLLKLDPVHGGGALGLYLVAADLPLLLLYGLWLRDGVKGVRAPARSATCVLLLMPFLLMGTISIAYSPRPLWAFVEVVRWLKVAAVLFYVSQKLSERALHHCLWALGLSVVLESSLGLGQMVTQSNLGLDKFGFFGAAGEQALTQELSSSETLFRGSALAGHPNYLAGYLPLVTPMFLTIALGGHRRSERWLASGVFVAGVGGLLSTMSRAAWVSLLGAGAFGFVLVAAFGMLTLRRAIALLLALVVTGAAGTMAVSDLVLKRFRSDFTESWQLRVDLNRTAMNIAADHPLGGVGLNNYTVVYPDYDPGFARQMEEMDGMLTVVHNLYALLLAEVGILGLGSFLVFLAGALVVIVRALPHMPPRHRPLAIGIISGVLGAMAFDFSEVSLWMDGSMYALAFLVGLLAILVSPSSSSAQSVGRHTRSPLLS